MTTVRGEDLHPASERARDIDPRVERSRDLVLTATVDLLREVGYGPLAIEAVAARSGVAKSTIYRHWDGKDELVADAFARLRGELPQPPPPGPVRDRVIHYLRTLAAKTQDPEWSAGACLPALIDGGERSEDMAEEVARSAEERVQPLVRVLDEGVAAGELAEGTDTALLADALVGPLLLRRLFHRRLVHPEHVPALVDLILGGA